MEQAAELIVLQTVATEAAMKGMPHSCSSWRVRPAKVLWSVKTLRAKTQGVETKLVNDRAGGGFYL